MYYLMCLVSAGILQGVSSQILSLGAQRNANSSPVLANLGIANPGNVANLCNAANIGANINTLAANGLLENVPGNFLNGNANQAGFQANIQAANVQAANLQAANQQAANLQAANIQAVLANQANTLTNNINVGLGNANYANAASLNYANSLSGPSLANGNYANGLAGPTLANANYANVANRASLLANNGVQGYPNFGIQVVADALEVGGELAVSGKLPIYSTVAVNGKLPSQGSASVKYSCGRLS